MSATSTAAACTSHSLRPAGSSSTTRFSDHLATQERLLSGLPRAEREALAECLRTLLHSLCDTAPELPRAASTKPRAPGETSAH